MNMISVHSCNRTIPLGPAPVPITHVNLHMPRPRTKRGPYMFGGIEKPLIIGVCSSSVGVQFSHNTDGFRIKGSSDPLTTCEVSYFKRYHINP